MADYEQKNIISFELKDRVTDKIENIARGMNGLSSYFEKFGSTATKSFNKLHKSFDRIANIVRYRLIRQSISLLVSQLGEGTKAVYKFAASVRETDQLHIADKLDRYATLLDNIRGNLGATWATFLANMSGYIEPILQKISDSFDKLSAYTAAIGGASEYWSVAESNAKRYFSTVANGLQDIKVIGQNTQMEKTPIPEDIAESAGKFKQNLALIGELTETTTKALAVILIATGHVVAGLELGAVALGISKINNSFEEEDPKSKVESVLSGIQDLRTSFGLGIGLVLLTHGRLDFALPLIVDGINAGLTKGASVDTTAEVKSVLVGLSELVAGSEIALGVALLCLGNIPFGLYFLGEGIVTGVTTTIQNWDFVKTQLERLGEIISAWWDTTFFGGIVKTWKDFWANPFDFGSIGKSYVSHLEESADKLESNGLTGWNNAAQRRLNQIDNWSNGIQLWQSGDYLKAIGSFGRSLLGFADGGFPSAGSIFVAGEVPGQTELLGTINGKTGVAGGAEITGIREAIYEVGAEMLSAIRSGNVNVTLEGDADKLFRVVKSKAVDYNRRTGNFAF